jgi:hypothetical protein
VIAIACSGCSSILGISDPKPATGDGGIDGMVDSHIDAPPPCAASITLKAEVASDLGKAGTGFVVGDFDNGGVDDIAVATGDDVIVLFGDNTGAFASPVTIPTAATDVVVDDFDADADDDFVMWTRGGTSVVVRRQNRLNNPPVEAEQPLTGPLANVQIAINGFLDGALVPDLLVHDDGGSRAYTANLGTPGTFARTNTVVGTGADALIALVQIDNAARADALFVNGADVKLSLQGNSGNDAFGALSTIATGVEGRGVGLGAFDGDALPDLVVSTANGLVLYRQTSPGTFAMHGVISPLRTTAPILVGDINEDGRDDLVLADAAVLQCAPATAGGAGVFTQVEAIAAAQPAALRDVTGDGKPDLVRIDGNTVKVRPR